MSWVTGCERERELASFRPSDLFVAAMTTTCPLATTPSISESSVDTIEA
jgi:hypothetical protein